MTRVTLVFELFINALALRSPEMVALVGLTVDSKTLLYLSINLGQLETVIPFRVETLIEGRGGRLKQLPRESTDVLTFFPRVSLHHVSYDSSVTQFITSVHQLMSPV